MEIGKVAETVLKRSIFKQLKCHRDEVIVGPGVGEDCAVLEIPQDDFLVLSTDPITGTEKGIGKLAVHVTLNDLAASGAEPIGVLVTLLLPRGYEEAGLKDVMQELTEVTSKYKVEIIGGHSEVTPAVNQVVISLTGVGKVKKNQHMDVNKLAVGDQIVMTKWAGLEGTTLIAKEKEDLINKKYHPDLVAQAKELDQYLSVVNDSRIAMTHGAKLMHDVTEGGVYGALWELGAKAGMGFEVQLDAIPIRQETIEIGECFDINPYQLIGSGSLLVVCNQGDDLVKALNEANIPSAVIGQLTSGNDRVVVHGGVNRYIKPAQSDELYKILT